MRDSHGTAHLPDPDLRHALGSALPKPTHALIAQGRGPDEHSPPDTTRGGCPLPPHPGPD